MFKETCERVQAAYRQGGKQAANKIKVDCLPCYMPTGVFKHRSIDGFDSPSRVVHGDIDIGDITASYVAREIDRIREALIKSKHTVFLHASPTGGIKFGFAISPVKTNEEYKEFWRGLEHHMVVKYGVKIDPACSDISRACFLAFDPAAYHNPDAEVFTKTRDEPEPKDAPTDAPNASDADNVDTSIHILDDDELIRRMFASATGAKARKLWDGDHSAYEQYDSQGDLVNDGESEGDLALCEILAFWTGKDEIAYML